MLLLAWGCVLCWDPGPTLAQSSTLRGELLHRNGEPATDVRLVIVGHPPEVVIRDGGMFQHTLSGTPGEVTLRVVGSPELEVLYPPDGRTPVPSNPETVVPIVVGERIGLVVEDRIAEDLRQLRETLEVRGVSADAIAAAVRAEMEGVVARIATITEGAVDRAVAGADRAELRERIGSRFRNWLRTGRDLVDAFGLIDVTRSMSQANFLALYNSMGAYSDSWAELDASLADAPQAVERGWPGELGVALGTRLADLLHRARTDFHEPVLKLREPLLVIQAESNGGHPGNAELHQARQAVVDLLPVLASSLASLEADVPPLLESLRDP